jgi:hypothetical protein
MPHFPSKMPKIPGICREYFFAYYAESNAGIIGLTLPNAQTAKHICQL